MSRDQFALSLSLLPIFPEGRGGRLYTGYKFRDLLDWYITLLFDQCQILFLLTFTTETILFLRAASVGDKTVGLKTLDIRYR